MDRDKLKYLFLKYFNNTVSKNELAELLNMIRESDEDHIDSIIEELKEKEPQVFKGMSSSFDREKVFDNILENIKKDKPSKHRLHKRNIKWLSIAAAILLMIGFSIIERNKQEPPIELKLVENNDIHLPEHNLAAVTLDDGRTLTLSNIDEATLNKEGIHLITTSDGELAFKIQATANGLSTYQTFNSPKGTSSTLILSDGSTVWLNSDSKITYPTSFSGNERRVTLEGEAYFDIQHNNDQPFIVSAQGTDIKVLGTEFNVATNIEPEKIFTTLISGAVEVYIKNNSVALSPGIQSITTPFSSKIKTHSVDLREIIAWKEGYFRFKDDDVESVLNKIKAWYDIKGFEVKELTADRFTGSVMRTKKLSDLLRQLEKISNYKFKIMEQKIIVDN